MRTSIMSRTGGRCSIVRVCASGRMIGILIMSRSDEFRLCLDCSGLGVFDDEEFGRYALGRIRIGDFAESFRVNLEYWSGSDYRSSWLKAIDMLEESESSTSCLVVSLADPESSAFAFCWPLYREGEVVFVQNSMILFEELSDPFEMDRPWLSVQPRNVVDEDGNRISEWSTSMVAVRELGRILQQDSGSLWCMCE
ncbi:hypothetical protein [Kitasatospora sp. NPDC093679]|uniref:hypothetical protein n=1 Tax=Kitasatospora sp. NPDC093679 TaxID=3154983 RepID=UPI0034327924